MNVEAVTAAFAALFGIASPRTYGTLKSVHQGVSDGAPGVQWNAGIDRNRDVLTLGVNLEGMEYDGWPIGRLIERELQSPQLPALAASHVGLAEAELWFSRDAWQASARPTIREQWLGPEPPVRLQRLDQDLWRRALLEADECLGNDGGRRRRAKQWVTLVTKGRAEKYVSPHLQIKAVLPLSVRAAGSDVFGAMNETRRALMPVCEWMSRRSDR